MFIKPGTALSVLIVCSGLGVSVAFTVGKSRPRPSGAVHEIDPFSKESMLDLGKLWESPQHKLEVTFRNPSDVPFVIDEVSSDCSCTFVGVNALTIPSRCTGNVHGNRI